VTLTILDIEIYPIDLKKDCGSPRYPREEWLVRKNRFRMDRGKYRESTFIL